MEKHGTLPPIKWIKMGDPPQPHCRRDPEGTCPKCWCDLEFENANVCKRNGIFCCVHVDWNKHVNTIYVWFHVGLEWKIGAPNLIHFWNIPYDCCSSSSAKLVPLVSMNDTVSHSIPIVCSFRAPYLFVGKIQDLSYGYTNVIFLATSP